MDVPVAYLQPPSTIVNQAIDMLGQSGQIIGDIADGTRVAETARRNYGQALRQLLRTAHWDFARTRVKLQLLGDATGNAPNEPGVSPFVECPWSYCYAWPENAIMGRWLPWNPDNGQPSINGEPLTTAPAPLVQYGQIPGRFLVSSSDKYPIETGSLPWNQLPDLQRTAGLGPIYRKTILTDCSCAEFVYTRFEPVIEIWDALFREAFVMMMALVIAPVALEDPKLRLAEVQRLVPMLKNAIADARVANGNESGFPQSVDHVPIWLTARSSNWWPYAGNNSTLYSGYTFYPYDSSMSWCGSVF